MCHREMSGAPLLCSGFASLEASLHEFMRMWSGLSKQRKSTVSLQSLEHSIEAFQVRLIFGKLLERQIQWHPVLLNAVISLNPLYIGRLCVYIQDLAGREKCKRVFESALSERKLIYANCAIKSRARLVRCDSHRLRVALRMSPCLSQQYYASGTIARQSDPHSRQRGSLNDFICQTAPQIASSMLSSADNKFRNHLLNVDCRQLRSERKFN